MVDSGMVGVDAGDRWRRAENGFSVAYSREEVMLIMEAYPRGRDRWFIVLIDS